MQRRQLAVKTRPLVAAVRAETITSLGDNAPGATRVKAAAKSPAPAPTVREALKRVSALTHPGGRRPKVGPPLLVVVSDNGRPLRASRGPVREVKAVKMDPEALTALERAAQRGIGAQVRRDIDRVYAYDCGVVILRRSGMETFRRAGPSPSPRALFAVGALSGMTTVLFPDRAPVKDPRIAASPIHGAAAYRRLVGDAPHKDQTGLRDRLLCLGPLSARVSLLTSVTSTRTGVG